jgi:purine-nucleoside phosphorylase
MADSVSCPGVLQQAAEELRPRSAIVLGSGLSLLAQHLQVRCEVPFAACPPLCATTVEGHSGKVLAGRWGTIPVLVFAGRNHFYEGHGWEPVLAPVSLARKLGVQWLILTSAAGGIRADLVPGTLMAVERHLDWTASQPWRSQPDGRPYCEAGRHLVKRAAEALGLQLAFGTYASVLGPCYETPAEIRALARLGADAVGMSTARESSAAAEMGLQCLAITCVTNRASGLSEGRLHHAEVLRESQRQAGRLAQLLTAFLQQVSSGG